MEHCILWEFWTEPPHFYLFLPSLISLAFCPFHFFLIRSADLANFGNLCDATKNKTTTIFANCLAEQERRIARLCVCRRHFSICLPFITIIKSCSKFYSTYKWRPQTPRSSSSVLLLLSSQSKGLPFLKQIEKKPQKLIKLNAWNFQVDGLFWLSILEA